VDHRLRPDPVEPIEAHVEASDVAGVLGKGLSTRLERWASEARVEDAARGRARERWLRQQAEEEMSVGGVLADLAEQGTPVSVHLRGGRQHQGSVQLVGDDFVALASPTADVIIALAAVTSVRTRRGAAPTSGDRTARSALRLADVVAGLAADRERALVATLDAGDAVAGELRSVGRDVVVVGVTQEPRALAYVRLDALAEVVLDRQRPSG
jgi:hypothetical protein